MRLVLVAILLVGGALRLVPLLRSPLIFDEYKMARLVDTVSLAPATFNLPLHGDNHPPGQVYWSYLSSRIFGENLLGYRGASLIAGLGTIAVIFLLARRLAGDAVGLLAALLAATNEYLIGTSRIGTELSVFLFLTVLSMLQLHRALEEPSVRRIAWLGVSLGLAALTKESALLLAVPTAVLLVRHDGGWSFLRQPPAWAGLFAFLVMVSPAIVWSATASVPPDDPSGAGFMDQASRLSIGSWSWGPSALYARSLYYYGVEPRISEYVSMTTVPGVVLLLGAVASLWVVRSNSARALQAIGFGVFFFFSLFSDPRGEFWWADLSLPPFLILTAMTLSRVSLPRTVVTVAAGALFLVPALRLAATFDNYHRLDIGAPSPEAVDNLMTPLSYTFVAFPERDQLVLNRLGGRNLPPLRQYHASLLAYRDYLRHPVGGTTQEWLQRFMALRHVPRDDLAWVERELRRVSAALPGEESHPPGLRPR